MSKGGNETNKKDVTALKTALQKRLQYIDREIQEQSEKVCNTDSKLTFILAILEKKIVSLEEQKKSITRELEQYEKAGYTDSSKFKEFCFEVIEHMTELLTQSESFEEVSSIFRFVFKDIPTYDEIVNRTAPIYPIFSLQSKKELSNIESSSVNLKWQARDELKRTNLEKYIEQAISTNKEEYEEQVDAWYQVFKSGYNPIPC